MDIDPNTVDYEQLIKNINDNDYNFTELIKMIGSLGSYNKVYCIIRELDPATATKMKKISVDWTKQINNVIQKSINKVNYYPKELNDYKQC